MELFGSGLWRQVGTGLFRAFPRLRLERTADGGLQTCRGAERTRYKRTSQEAAVVCGMQVGCQPVLLLLQGQPQLV